MVKAMGSCTWFMVLVAIFFFFMPRNPTQSISKLYELVAKGRLPQGENLTVFDSIYSGLTGNEQQKVKGDASVANSFYNIATELYEYGWGDSFHFGWRKQSEGHEASVRNSQVFVAQKLQVGDMDPVLDMGCGIGGPLRGIVRATGAKVTGVTINEFQVERARQITSRLSPYMQARCHYQVEDYLNIKGLEPESFVAAFYMESSLHCENRTKTFEQAYRLLKPGGRLVAMEYVTLPGWDESNPEHVQLMKWHLHGNGAARTPSIPEDLEMIRKAGFEIKEHFDFMEWGKKLYGEDEFPWWGDLQADTAGVFPRLPSAHPWIRRPLPYLLHGLAKIGLLETSVAQAAELMNIGGDGLSGLGKVGALTPQYYVLGIKPLSKE